MLEIVVTTKDGKLIKRRELVGDSPIKIGRSSGCDLHVPIEDVSREHARVARDREGRWVVRDLESTHGCVVGNERRPIIVVEPGLEVAMGSARVKFGNVLDRVGEELNRLIVDDSDNLAVTADTRAKTADIQPPKMIPLADRVAPPAKKEITVVRRRAS